MIFISVVLAAVFLIAFACAASMLLLRDRTTGPRLLVLAPIPGAVAVGICTATYLLSYASDYFAVALFAAIFVLAAWLLGLVFCLLAAVIMKARGSQG